MASAGTAVVEFTGDFSKLTRQASVAVSGLSSRLNSALDVDSNSVGRRLATRLGSAAAMAGKAVAIGVGAGLGAAGGFGLQLAAQSEQAEIAFTNLLGSAQAAGDYMAKLRDFAARTPFEFPDLRDAASRFIAVGVEADRVIPIMTTLGDATSAMGTGSEGINRATTALTQMSQKGKVSAEEMLQLTEAGIPAWDALAATLGVDVATAQKMVTDRQVEANTMFQALETSAGPALQRVTGMMEAQSQTLSGMLSTLKDVAGQGLAEALAPAVDILKNALPGITDALGRLISGVGPSLGKIFDALGTALPALLDALVPVATLFADVLAGLVEAFAPALQALSPYLATFGEILGETVLTVLDALAPVLPDLVAAFGQLAVVLGEGLADALIILLPVLPPLVELLTTIVEFVAMIPPEVITAIALAFLAFQAVGPILTVASTAVSVLGVALGLLLSPIGLIVAAVVGIGAAVYLAYQHFEPFRAAVDSAWQALQRAWDAIVGFIEPFLPKLIELGEAWFRYLIEPLRTVGEVIVKVFQGDFAGAWDVIAGFPARMFGLAKDLVVSFVEGIGPLALALVKKFAQAWLAVWAWVYTDALPAVLRWMADLIPAFIGWVVDAVPQLLAALGRLLVSLAGWIVETAPKIAAQFGQWALSAVGWVLEAIVRLPLVLIQLWFTLLDWIVTAQLWLMQQFATWAIAAVQWVWDAIVAIPGALASLWSTIWGWITSVPGLIVQLVTQWVPAFFTWIVDIIAALPEQLASVWSTIWTWLTGLPGLIAEAAVGIYNAFKDIGASIITAIGEGLMAAVEWVGDVAESIWDAVWEMLKDHVFEPIVEFSVDLPGPLPTVSPFEGLGDLLGLASGGLVNKPTLAMIGEAGPELVLPLNDPQRMAALLAQYAPITKAQSGLVVDPNAPATAPPATDVSGVDAWALAVVERLRVLPEQIWAAMAPGMALWEAEVGLVLRRLQAAFDLFMFNARAAWYLWAAYTLPAATLPPMQSWSMQMTSVITSMISTITTSLTSAVTTWAQLGYQAGSSYVAHLTGQLNAGTTSVATIVWGYVTSLVNGLNPILQAVGQQPIRLAQGGIVGFAAGGFNERHVAQIAPAGAWRVWAEPETGGEAYIPLARSKRRRSRAIAAETVARLGGVAQFAGGGVTGNTAGLNGEFLNRVTQWSNAVGEVFRITSGYRDIAQQQRLYAAYLSGRGNLAARPGSSMHNFGLAIDGPHWGSRNPGAFGLVYSVRGEPWHVEPFEARAWARGMPAAGWGDSPGVSFNQLPEPPAIDRTGWVADVARAAMTWVYTKATEWASTALAGVAGAAPSPDPGAFPGGSAVSIGQQMAAARGWVGAEWNALYNLWQKESGWNPLADNPTSSAYGIPQALPGSKMASKGADWRTNPATQIAWGLDYIAGRYGSPAAAWAHSQRLNWYRRGGLAFVHRQNFDSGGTLRPGFNVVNNETGADERLVPAGRGSAVSISEAHFHEGVDYEMFLQRTAFMVKAGRL